MYSQFPVAYTYRLEIIPYFRKCICSCFSIYSSILYQGQHICMYIHAFAIYIQVSVVQVTPFSFNGTSATLGWNQRFKVPSSVRFNDFHENVALDLRRYFMLDFIHYDFPAIFSMHSMPLYAINNNSLSLCLDIKREFNEQRVPLVMEIRYYILKCLPNLYIDFICLQFHRNTR